MNPNKIIKNNIVKVIGIVVFILYLFFFFWAMSLSIHPENGFKGAYIGTLPIFELMMFVGLLIHIGQFLYFKDIFNGIRKISVLYISLNVLWLGLGALLLALGQYVFIMSLSVA